jgi:hypothetical protein
MRVQGHIAPGAGVGAAGRRTLFDDHLREAGDQLGAARGLGKQGEEAA